MNNKTMLEKVIDSDNFTVGGGASSAISGAMAGGMISMVSKLSLKKDYGLDKDKYLQIASECDQLAKCLLDGAKMDEEAFCMLRDAYRLPKQTLKEKESRTKAIEEGAIEAARIPKENGEKCKRVYELGQILVNASNPNAKTDLMIAIDLSKIGIVGCMLNIQANIGLIKDETKKKVFLDAIDNLRI